MSKVILVSIDGMRPDGLKMCGSCFLDDLIKMSSYTFDARTVYPSITLPCHLSMFQSVPPERHGTLSNEYVTPVRPVNGLLEQLLAADKRSAMYYGWEHPSIFMPTPLNILMQCLPSGRFPILILHILILCFYIWLKQMRKAVTIPDG